MNPEFPSLPMPADDGDPPASRTVLYPEILVDARFEEPPPEPRPPNRRLPVLLFIATCLSSFGAQSGHLDRFWALILGAEDFVPHIRPWEGLQYALALMTILLCHEFGHYLQARHYEIPASLPHFVPMPLPPIGTLGAVIGMRPRAADDRALFDLAITGPIAGLIPALIFSYAGLQWSTFEPMSAEAQPGGLGVSILFGWIADLAVPSVPENHYVLLHPVAFAGWFGILITSLNLIPIGQLDGGHILYTLVPGRAHLVSMLLLAAAAAAVVFAGYGHWALMILLLILIGPRHPPTARGRPLDRKRIVLGWLMLLFVLVGFTPRPFIF